MSGMFEKLMTLRQINFKDGSIHLFNQPMVIFPVDYLITLTKWMNTRPELIPELYEISKIDLQNGFGLELAKSFGFKKREFIDWLFSITNLAGWGTAKLIEMDIEKGTGTLRIADSPVAKVLKDKVSCPIDFIWRGVGAGCASAVYKKEIDYIETKCVALGDPYCEFKFMPRDTINKNDFKYLSQIVLK